MNNAQYEIIRVDFSYIPLPFIANAFVVLLPNIVVKRKKIFS